MIKLSRVKDGLKRPWPHRAIEGFSPVGKKGSGHRQPKNFKMKRLATIHGDTHNEYYRQVPLVAILEPFLAVSRCRIPGLYSD